MKEYKKHLSSSEAYEDVLHMLRQLLADGIDGSYEVRIKKIACKITYLQNRSMHRWFRRLAKVLNDAGWPFKKLMNWRADKAISHGFKVCQEYETAIPRQVVEQLLTNIHGSLYQNEMDWTEDRVKYDLWGIYQKNITGVDSTAKLTKEQVTVIHKELERDLSQSFGVYEPWPVDKDKRAA